MDKFVERVRATGFTFRFPNFLRSFAFRPLAMASEFLSPAGLPVADENLPASAYAFGEIAEAKTYQRLFQTALALYLYRHEFGSYPNTLSELTPRFLPYVPKDPFYGNPLRYRREGHDFKVWSVGDNLKDENEAPREWLKGEFAYQFGFNAAQL